MGITPTPPVRHLEWPSIIHTLRSAVDQPHDLYIVGGAVRDVLRGHPVRDIDLATPHSGLSAARQIADQFSGSYYPVDPERGTGRAIITSEEQEFIIDVASFRGDDLLGDLQGRDFTINAMAVCLAELEGLLDPLGGQTDLFKNKVVRQCLPTSIASDPIRALRAVRHSLQFNLRMMPDTTSAIRNNAPRLTAEDGHLVQPERVRDELMKMLAGPKPVSAVRLLDALGLWPLLTPFTAPPSEYLAVADNLHNLLTVISPQRTDNTAASVTFGVAVMVLDRFRGQLQEYIRRPYADSRTFQSIAMLAAITPPSAARAGQAWSEHLRLSNLEGEAVDRILASAQSFPYDMPVDDRTAHRFFRAAGEHGLGGILYSLAVWLVNNPTSGINTEVWGTLLDKTASPLFEAYFRRHQSVITPPPLLTGNDLIETFNVTPGPVVGDVLRKLLEEQAAGALKTKKQALRYAEHLLAEHK